MNETLDCKSILESIKKLSHSEQIALSEQVLKMLSIPTTNKTGLCDDLIDFRGEKPNCPHCGAKASSKSILKHGFDNGRQRYYCKECKRNFFATTNSVFARTRKNADTWRKFVELTISGASLHTCCIECHLAHQTAFVWRHKILNALQHDQDNRVLGGIIETDDMYISISYKGNHKHSKNFTMPRPAFKRGSDNRGQLSSRACVTCAYERNGQSYGEVLGKGQPTIAMFSHAFAKRIIPESIVLTDKSTGIRNYFENNASVELIQLLAHVKPKSMNAPPEVKGVYHIQNVNNMHSRFRRFLKNYCGVSTKYLNHYLSLFIWLENHKKINNVNYEEEIINDISMNGTYIKAKDVLSLPVIPLVA